MRRNYLRLILKEVFPLKHRTRCFGAAVLAALVLAMLCVPALAAEIAPDWDLPAGAVQRGLETLRSHLELARGGALLYEMI